MKKILIFGLIIMAVSACNSEKKVEEKDQKTAAASIDGSVSFVEPLDGAMLSSPVKIVMRVEGMEVEPAGMVNEGKGHHHLIIDGDYVEAGVMVPADSTHIHFGKGQTEVELPLSPGKHSLTLQFADGIHTSFGKEWSSTIQITVEAPR